MEKLPRQNLSFDLRPATIADADFLYRLYCTTREDELNAANFPTREREAFLQMQFNAQKTHYEKFYSAAEHHIISAEGRAVGRQYVERAANQIFLIDLVLLPEFCNRGIGTVLLERLREESSRGEIPLRLYADKFNHAALRFYERLGFQVADDTGIYLFLEWHPAIGKPEKI